MSNPNSASWTVTSSNLFFLQLNFNLYFQLVDDEIWIQKNIRKRYQWLVNILFYFSLFFQVVLLLWSSDLDLPLPRRHLLLLFQVERPQHLHHPVRHHVRLLRRSHGPSDARPRTGHVHPRWHRHLRLPLLLHEVLGRQRWDFSSYHQNFY